MGSFRRLAVAVTLSLALTGCVTVPAPGTGPNDTLRTERGNLVVPLAGPPGVFEVFPAPGDGPSDYWCAAAEFAEDGLYLAHNARLYVLRPLGPSETQPGRKSVIFTSRPDAALLETSRSLPDSLTMRVDEFGREFLWQHGRLACRPILIWPFTD